MLGEDSDYFIFGAPYIPLSSINVTLHAFESTDENEENGEEKGPPLTMTGDYYSASMIEKGIVIEYWDLFDILILLTF